MSINTRPSPGEGRSAWRVAERAPPSRAGGTANPLCAGLGIPVVSIDEKGKRVQKKLLGDAEILVKVTSEMLADEALRVLGDRSGSRR